MNNSVLVLDEPQLEFGFGQRTYDPRDGLSLFGPYDSGIAKPINYILLGTKEGIHKFRQWSSLLSQPAIDAPKGNQRLWTPYPGFFAAYGTDWPVEPLWSHELDTNALNLAAQHSDKYERAFTVVNKYLDGIRIASERDERIGVAICIVPDHVWQNCRPQSVVKNPTEQISIKRIKSRKAGQLELYDPYDSDQYFMSTDFRRQLKARGMEFDFPIQIIRESTLRPDSINKFGQRGLTPLSDRLWNLSATLYYKCGGKPWRLVTAREGVCYIGIAFKKAEEESNTACCAAQMFLDTGDGVVFLGKFGPWFSPDDKQFHLDKNTARNLSIPSPKIV